jgi:hypothetical protein
MSKEAYKQYMENQNRGMFEFLNSIDEKDVYIINTNSRQIKCEKIKSIKKFQNHIIIYENSGILICGTGKKVLDLDRVLEAKESYNI